MHQQHLIVGEEGSLLEILSQTSEPLSHSILERAALNTHIIDWLSPYPGWGA